ncbi:MAG: LytR/AlgR family response regulator transcription factor [Flavobacteriales bacterium]
MKSKYNCIIIDDERYARELIVDYLKDFPEFAIIGKYKSTSLAKDIIESDLNLALIFLDIQMPNETGIEFLKNNSLRTKVIFTTAYSEYAIESYDLNVADYLLKPIRQDRFNKAIEKLLIQLEVEEKAKAFEMSAITNSNYIKIKSGSNTHKIYFNELIRLEADGEYIRFFTQEKTYFVLGSLKKIIEQLPTSFMQIHRSHIITLSQVRSREGYLITLNDFSKIPIGKTYRTQILKQLKLQGF